MNAATIIVTFDMCNAWSEVDTAETGLQPAKGVNEYLVNEGFSIALSEMASRFGMELRRWGISIHEQKGRAK